ncbi:MAG: tetratricopeptide repeat protein [Acidobacteria bacterium]|nr:MAG: tetratricopeptide repeat protein [Acidobacteriota bacterium]
MSRFAVLVWLCLQPLISQTGAFAQGHPPSQVILEGQEAIYHLQYDKAGEIFTKTRNDYPSSPVGYGMLSILAWNQLLFESSNFALDDYSTPSPFVKARTRKPIAPATRRFHQANDALLAKCEELLNRDPNDVRALYFQGLGYENLAAEALVISKDDRAASSYGRRAKRIHERGLELDRNLVDAKVSLAAYDFAADNLPWSLRLFAFLLGIRGDEQRAFQRLREVAEKGEYRRYDAWLLLGLVKAWKGKREYAAEAVDVFEILRRKFPENFLLDLNLAAMYEKNDPRSALKLYESLLAALPSKAKGLEPGEVWWRMGRCNYRLRNYDQALQAFGKALDAPRSEKETAPLVRYYQGLIHETQGDRARAIQCYQAAVKDQSLTAISKEIYDARRRLEKLMGS